MGNYVWSAQNRVFLAEALLPSYDDAGWNLSDIIKIDDSIYIEFNGNPPVGKQRGVINGMPAWVDLPPPTSGELISSANAEKSRLKSIADSGIEWRQDAVNDGSASDREIADLAAWRKYRVALMRIDTSKAPDIEWPIAP
ncbi:tail fiber assembly protein [Yersinia ruckeri]|uniref:tail fiber assembly protein n=1 Tax=Yersinia ruckeri TaxID=29486 RepID=UPI002237A6E7|nr:tail fiber assembly protein [Yersinia ruckeri]MCW6550381.1 tail fiber assembly protein [Yersinia ruckeri]